MEIEILDMMKKNKTTTAIIAVYVIEHGKSLNAAVEEAIEHMVGS